MCGSGADMTHYFVDTVYGLEWRILAIKVHSSLLQTYSYASLECYLGITVAFVLGPQLGVHL